MSSCLIIIELSLSSCIFYEFISFMLLLINSDLNSSIVIIPILKRLIG